MPGSPNTVNLRTRSRLILGFMCKYSQCEGKEGTSNYHPDLLLPQESSKILGAALCSSYLDLVDAVEVVSSSMIIEDVSNAPKQQKKRQYLLQYSEYSC